MAGLPPRPVFNPPNAPPQTTTTMVGQGAVMMANPAHGPPPNPLLGPPMGLPPNFVRPPPLNMGVPPSNPSLGGPPQTFAAPQPGGFPPLAHRPPLAAPMVSNTPVNPLPQGPNMTPMPGPRGPPPLVSTGMPPLTSQPNPAFGAPTIQPPQSHPTTTSAPFPQQMGARPSNPGLVQPMPNPLSTNPPPSLVRPPPTAGQFPLPQPTLPSNPASTPSFPSRPLGPPPPAGPVAMPPPMMGNRPPMQPPPLMGAPNLPAPPPPLTSEPSDVDALATQGLNKSKKRVYAQPSNPSLNTNMPGPGMPASDPFAAQPPLYNPPAGNLAPNVVGPSAPPPTLNPPVVRGMETLNLVSAKLNFPTNPPPAPRPDLPESFLRKNSSPATFRCTLNAVPNTKALLQKSRVPFGIHLRPFSSKEPIVLLDPTMILRCKKCRGYLNPFITQLEAGTKWRCNLCTQVNDFPDGYDYDPHIQQTVDRASRAELTMGTLEYLAPAEYLVRAPQPVCYMFLIDVSSPAVQSGMVQEVCKTILENLPNITCDSRTRVGFIAYGKSLTYFNMRASAARPSALTVADPSDVFIPCPGDELLVNLKECESLVRTVLSMLPSMVTSSQESAFSSLSVALKAASELMGGMGGRVTVFQFSLPNTGEGALKNRTDPAAMGTPKETSLLNPASDFYKQYAADVSRKQITVDCFLFNNDYSDVATVASLARHSAGTVFFYPSFHAKLKPDGAEKLSIDLGEYLTRVVGVEAVLRMRASHGLNVHTYHGHFFVRSADLLALPVVSPGHAYAFQISMDEDIGDDKPLAYFQAALLYTTHSGERRIRVHNMALPVTSDLAGLYAAVDAPAVAVLAAKMAIDHGLRVKLSDAREALSNIMVDILSAFRANFAASNQLNTALLAPASMKYLALYLLGLIKNPAFRGSGVSLDERAYAMILFKILPLDDLFENIYPRLYSLHDMSSQIGTLDENLELLMPCLLPLSAEKLSRNGLYLLCNGVQLYMFVGCNVSAEILTEGFGVSSFAQLPDGLTTLPVTNTGLHNRLYNIIVTLRSRHSRHLPLLLIKDDSKNSHLFFQHMIDDRGENAMSYLEFLNFLYKEVTKP